MKNMFLFNLGQHYDVYGRIVCSHSFRKEWFTFATGHKCFKARWYRTQMVSLAHIKTCLWESCISKWNKICYNNSSKNINNNTNNNNSKYTIYSAYIKIKRFKFLKHIHIQYCITMYFKYKIIVVVAALCKIFLLNLWLYTAINDSCELI